MATREHLVVLRVLSDDPSRPWWESLGLPEPDRWTLHFPRDVFVEVETAVEVLRPDTFADRLQSEDEKRRSR